MIASEYFYGPHDSDCCPSGRATTYWLYIHGGLTPQVAEGHEAGFGLARRSGPATRGIDPPRLTS